MEIFTAQQLSSLEFYDSAWAFYENKKKGGEGTNKGAVMDGLIPTGIIPCNAVETTNALGWHCDDLLGSLLLHPRNTGLG